MCKDKPCLYELEETLQQRIPSQLSLGRHDRGGGGMDAQLDEHHARLLNPPPHLPPLRVHRRATRALLLFGTLGELIAAIAAVAAADGNDWLGRAHRLSLCA